MLLFDFCLNTNFQLNYLRLENQTLNHKHEKISTSTFCIAFFKRS